jgi:hypothetical protein
MRAFAVAVACSILLAGDLVAAVPGEDAGPRAAEPGSAPTDDRAVVRMLANWVQRLQGNAGQWSFVFEDVQMFLVTDQAADRMRIVAPVADATMLSHGQLRVLMEANFDRALDAKYAIFEGSVWSIFVHPLAELSEDELESAIRQVAALQANYGTTFSSMGVVFGQSVPGTPESGEDDVEGEPDDE